MNGEQSREILSFTDNHPGSKYAYIKKRKLEVVPMISNVQGFPDLESLQLKKNVTSSVKHIRERYFKLALLLGFPFKDLDNIKYLHIGKTLSE